MTLVRAVIVAIVAFSLSGCANFMTKFTTFQANFNAVVDGINADIAKVAPVVAAGCADIQKYGMLIVPFIPKTGRAQQYVDSANAAITTYCQNIPTDIPTTAAAVAKAVSAAQNAYYSLANGGQ